MSIKSAEKVFLALCLAMAASAASAGLCDDGGGSDNDYNSGKEVKSFDPNDIVGPEGKGAQRYVSRGERLEYTIDFENVTNASASAQKICVTLPQDPNLDWTTLELGEIAMGSRSDLGFVGKKAGSVSTGLTTTEGYSVRSSVEEKAGNLVWTMRIWDDTTYDNYPEDALAGILPPNNKETHCGEGYVKYSVCVKTNAAQNAKIEACATIVFDTNEPIVTDPSWTNTVGLAIDVGAADWEGDWDGDPHGINVVVNAPSGTTVTYCESEDGTYSATPVTYTDVGTNTVWFTVEKDGYTPYVGSALVVIRPTAESPLPIEAGETSEVFEDYTTATNSAARMFVRFPSDLAPYVSQEEKESYVNLFRVVTKETAGGWRNEVEFTTEAARDLKESLTDALSSFDLSRITLENTEWVVPDPVKGLYYALERTEDLTRGFDIHQYSDATSVSVTFTVNEVGKTRAFFRLLISACPPE
jgi:hypothetical protein